MNPLHGCDHSPFARPKNTWHPCLCQELIGAQAEHIAIIVSHVWRSTQTLAFTLEPWAQWLSRKNCFANPDGLGNSIHKLRAPNFEISWCETLQREAIIRMCRNLIKNKCHRWVMVLKFKKIDKLKRKEWNACPIEGMCLTWYNVTFTMGFEGWR